MINTCSMNMKKPLRIWSADREKRYGVVAESFDNLLDKASTKLGVPFCQDTKLVLEEDGTVIDESYYETLKDHTRLILLQPAEVWQPPTLWPPEKGERFSDCVDGSDEKLLAEKLFLKLQQNPAIMVILDLSEMEIIKDADVDEIDCKIINKDIAKGLQEKCTNLYLTKKKEEEALEVIDLLKKRVR